MKIYINTIQKIIYLLVIVTVTSCSIDDIKPLNQLTEDNTIRDEVSAQQVLNGIYDLGREHSLSSFPLYLAAYGNEGLITTPLSGSTGFNNNEVPVDNQFLASLYNGQYKIINSCNFLIQGLEADEAVDISKERRDEMIAEAKFQRALSYFNLVRYFGQFYDTNSSLGVVLRTQFSKELTSSPRSTVQQVYEFIQKDLQFAVNNGPVFIDHFYAGRLASKALLAKVELYMGNYDVAATLANEVINNSEGYVLEPNYADIFSKRFYSSEVIFAPFASTGVEGGSTMDLINRTSYNEQLRSTADAQEGTDNDGDLSGSGTNYDPRFSFAYSEATQGPNFQGKYPYTVGATSEGNTMYHLRLAELYLIHAEAEVRRNGDLNIALESLNAIRSRAGVAPKTLVNDSTLLEDIRQEKLLELFFENGESWFDIVRYHSLGNLTASTIKESLTSEDKFALPIPLQVIVGNNSVKQNPGY